MPTLFSPILWGNSSTLSGACLLFWAVNLPVLTQPNFVFPVCFIVLAF